MAGITITWSVLALAIGLVLGIIGAATNKSSTRKILFMWGFPIAGAAFLLLIVGSSLPDQLQFFNKPISGDEGKVVQVGGTTVTYVTQPVQTTPPTQSSICPVEDTTVTLSAQDEYLSTSTGGTHRYKIDGAPALTVSDAGTLTPSPGNKLDILWNNATSTSAYSIIDSVVVPCDGTVTFTAKTVNNGSLTTRVYNEEGNLLDTSTENETLGVGDVVNLNIELQGDYQKKIPYGLILVVEYNKSTIDDVVINLDGVELSSANVPTSFSPNYGVDSAKKSFFVPEIISNVKKTGTVTIDADDANNPGSDTDGDLRFVYFPLNPFINEDKGGAYDGPDAEDEDNAVTRTGQFSYTLSVD